MGKGAKGKSPAETRFDTLIFKDTNFRTTWQQRPKAMMSCSCYNSCESESLGSPGIVYMWKHSDPEDRGMEHAATGIEYGADKNVNHNYLLILTLFHLFYCSDKYNIFLFSIYILFGLFVYCIVFGRCILYIMHSTSSTGYLDESSSVSYLSYLSPDLTFPSPMLPFNSMLPNVHTFVIYCENSMVRNDSQYRQKRIQYYRSFIWEQDLSTCCGSTYSGASCYINTNTSLD